jgi:crotonobetainyl-CoA:carnitine CoA-transferase CaiB-like acyl-CoA transferase
MLPVLSGVRILDLSHMLAGPYGTQLLSDLGAEVIKIERPDGGDGTRGMGQYEMGGAKAFFLSVNRGKKSLTLDLKEKKGKEIFYELVKKSDVVYDNFRVGVLEKLGCDYETLKKVNPRIISCSISTYGQYGPYWDRPGFDLLVQALSGGMSVTGEVGGAPVRAGIPIGDVNGGIMAAYAVAAALYSREKTGVGQRIDISLLDAQVSQLIYVAQYYLAGSPVPGPVGSGHYSMVPYQAFATKDIYIVVAAGHYQHFWEKLAQALGDEQLMTDPRFATPAKRLKNREVLVSILQEIFLTKTGDEWVELLVKAGVPCAPVNTMDRVIKDPQVLARDMLVEIDHPTRGKTQYLGNPVKMPEMSEELSLAPPDLGEHTEEILGELLGYSPEQINELRREGLV